jgi:putative ABC transport system substrate-binding protein
LKEAARGLVPDEVIDRPTGYFTVPALTYLHDPLLEFVPDVLDHSRHVGAAPVQLTSMNVLLWRQSVEPGSSMRRRELLALLGSAATGWPLAARAQQRERMWRLGVLMTGAADDPQSAARIAALAQGLSELGWTIGRNVRLDYRWGGGSPDDIRKHAAELAALSPNVIVANGSLAVAAAQAVTRTVPIVFSSVIDPVGAGFVESLARPGGNTTGFTLFEYGVAGKWLELLKEIAPRVTRAAVLRDPGIAAGSGQLGAIQSVAPQLGVELRPVGVRDAGEIERGLSTFASGANGGVIVTGSGLALVHRELIIALVARHRLPAVYSSGAYAISGGLISYGPDSLDLFHRVAGYVDRILKGEKPADLPVQAPTKYELVINLKTAKALGLDVPPTLLARADEVIE